MSLFYHFQNRLGLVTLILAVFKIDWAWRHSFWPFPKSFGLCDTHFSRFKNHLGIVTYAFDRIKNKWLEDIVSKNITIIQKKVVFLQQQ